jgi:very-short-patch-repair endonuclease
MWTEVARGVYLVGGHRFTDEARVRAAGLWGGPDSLVSGPAAAYWHGLVDSPGRIVDLAAPVGFRRRPPGWIRPRRRRVDELDRTEVRGIGVTGLALTVLEATAVVPNASAFLDRALQRSVAFGELYEAYCRSVGTRGMARAGRYLVAAADRADSSIERTLVRLLRRAGIDGFVVGLPFGNGKIDLAFPAARIAVEIDSWAWHTDPDRFRADRRKGNDLVAAGWTLRRFTWHDIVERPEATVSRIRAALARAA